VVPLNATPARRAAALAAAPVGRRDGGRRRALRRPFARHGLRTGQQAEGRIQLVLEEEPMALRQWVVVDGQNRATRVTLTQAEIGGRFSPALFAFNDPRFREALGERPN
jgi:hypothetical protein